MRNTVIVGWVFSIAALITMVIGHLGGHELNWKENQISTYAATAPYDYLVTTSMLLSAAALLITGILVSKYKILGANYLVHFIPLLAGAAASGLVMLTYYEETSRTLATLKQSGFWAVRHQSFHDAGLQIFFYSAVILVTALGAFTILFKSTMAEKFIGGCIFILGPWAYLFMNTPWAEAIGIVGVTGGLQQRVSLLCLWLAMICLLTIASNKPLQPTAASST